MLTLALVAFGEAWRSLEKPGEGLVRTSAAGSSDSPEHQGKNSGPQCMGLEVTVHGGPLPSRFGELAREMA